MKKRPASSKKPRPAKKPAGKSAKTKKPVKAVAKSTAKRSKAAAKPARKPEPARKPAKPAKAARAKATAKPAARGRIRSSSPLPAYTGKMLTESELRRMPESGYMAASQVEFFRQRLLQMRTEVINREVGVKERLHQRESFADPADRATAEEEHWLDLRLRERESLLLRKIDESLQRIRDREYGYCEVTGEPIGIPRLLARPTATVCVDVKGQNEQLESQFRDR